MCAPPQSLIVLVTLRAFPHEIKLNYENIKRDINIFQKVQIISHFIVIDVTTICIQVTIYQKRFTSSDATGLLLPMQTLLQRGTDSLTDINAGSDARFTAKKRMRGSQE